MISKFFLFSAAAMLLLSACTKHMSDVPANTALTSNQSAAVYAQALVADRGWYGYYGGDNVYNSDTLFADKIIKNGVATLPFYSNSPDVFSLIQYDIPANHVISGDSLVYEVKIKNPKDQYHSDWDVFINIKGTKHEAYVNFVADSAYTQYTRAFVGDAAIAGQASLVHDFETFATIKVVLKDNKAKIRLNGALLGTINYGADNQLGQVKTILFGGKGYPSCTSVKLLNSYSNNQILTENFNTDGKSTVVYY